MAPPMGERFEMRLDEDILARVDGWRSQQVDLPSRAEAMRRLVEVALAKGGSDTVTFSDGDKLLILMMRDLYEHLKVKDPGIDPEFLGEVIWGGHYWAAKWNLPGVFHGHEDDPRDLHFVLDVLDMWDAIERAYSKLTKKDKAAIERDAAPLGTHVRFSGFDGNNESSHLGIALFLVNKMDRFTRFQGRDLNAHMPTLATHRRMLPIFAGMRKHLPGAELSASQITELLQARTHPDNRPRSASVRRGA